MGEKVEHIPIQTITMRRIEKLKRESIEAPLCRNAGSETLALEEV